MKKNPTTIIIVALITLLSVNIINAQTWAPVGSPIAGTDKAIYALEVYDNKLFAGGYNISTAGTIQANVIAAWDGSNWTNPFGNTIVAGGRVDKMCVLNNKLVALGAFALASNPSSSVRMAEWNGTSWSTPYGNLSNANIWDMIVFNGELYVAHTGTLQAGSPLAGVEKWNGSNWANVGGLINGQINDLEIYNGELYIIGDFLTPANKIGKWNGTSWVTIGLGLANTGLSMQSANGKLYTVEQTLMNAVKSWNGASLSVDPSLTSVSYIVKFGSFNNQLILGGFSSSSTCGPFYCQPSFYNGSSFIDIPISTATQTVMNESAFKVYNGELYAAFLSGGVGYYNYLAKLNGTVGFNYLNEVATELKVFPNPTQNSLNIDLPIQNEEMTIELINSLGVSVYKTRESKPKLVVNTSSFSNGIYIVKVSTIKSVMFSKFIKE